MSLLKRNVSENAFFFSLLFLVLFAALLGSLLRFSEGNGEIDESQVLGLLAQEVPPTSVLFPSPTSRVAPTITPQPTTIPPQPTATSIPQPTTPYVSPYPTFPPTITPRPTIIPTQPPSSPLLPTTSSGFVPTSTPTPTSAPNIALPGTTPNPEPPLLVIAENGLVSVPINDSLYTVQIQAQNGFLTAVATEAQVPTALAGTQVPSSPTPTTTGIFSLFDRLLGRSNSRTQFVTTLPQFPFVTHVALRYDGINTVGNWLDPYEIKLSAGADENIYMTRFGVTAATELPVRLSLSRRSLSLLTPIGEQKVVYLPDTIVQYLQDLDLIGEIATPQAKGWFDVFAAEKKYPIYLGWKDNRLTYRVTGKRQEYLLAFLPISLGVTVDIDAKTREILDISYNSRIQKILDIISI